MPMIAMRSKAGNHSTHFFKNLYRITVTTIIIFREKTTKKAKQSSNYLTNSDIEIKEIHEPK